MKILEKKLDALMRFAASDNDFEREKIRLEIRKLLCDTDPEVIYHEKERQVRKLLLKLNAPDYMNGFPYLVDAILLTMKDEIHVMNLNWGIYVPLSKKYNVSRDTIYRCIQNIIEAICNNAPADEMARLFPNEKVSPAKFIARIANVVKYDLEEGGGKKCR